MRRIDLTGLTYWDRNWDQVRPQESDTQRYEHV